MRANHVRRRLAAGEPSIGTWLALPTPEGADYVSKLGFDWLVVDTEHNAVDIRMLAQMFIAISGSATAPMVRIPSKSHENIKRMLDAGAWGVVVPMVNSRAGHSLLRSERREPAHRGGFLFCAMASE